MTHEKMALVGISKSFATTHAAAYSPTVAPTTQKLNMLAAASKNGTKINYRILYAFRIYSISE